MEFLNHQIAKLAKSKKRSLLRKQISCGIFQEFDHHGITKIVPEKEAKSKEKSV